MNEEAEKAAAYSQLDAEGPAYEENLDHTVIEVLRDSKYRIEGMERRINYLQPKADAFDALLAITRAGDRYGNSGLMAEDGYGATYQIDRTLEKLFRQAMTDPARDTVADSDGDDGA